MERVHNGMKRAHNQMKRAHNQMKRALNRMKRAHKQMKGAHKDDCGTNLFCTEVSDGFPYKTYIGIKLVLFPYDIKFHSLKFIFEFCCIGSS